MNESEKKQRAKCNAYGSEFVPSLGDLKVGLATQTLSESPIYGVRSALVGDTTGWYLWAGPFSDDPEFFKPVHAEHIITILPILDQYLGLAPGYKFIIDTNGYEDVWFEQIIT